MIKSTKLALAAILAALAYSASSYGITLDANSASTKVSFVDAERYADVSQSQFRSERHAKATLDGIRETFAKRASKYLPNGYTLEVQVLDIDLAGDQSPLTSTFGDIRVMGDVFPPRIAFDYVVKDASEQPVLSGSERLVDLNYNYTLRAGSLHSDDRAAHVKELVRNWVARDLRRELQR